MRGYYEEQGILKIAQIGSEGWMVIDDDYGKDETNVLKFELIIETLSVGCCDPKNSLHLLISSRRQYSGWDFHHPQRHK
jgi:hypothetical protein